MSLREIGKPTTQVIGLVTTSLIAKIKTFIAFSDKVRFTKISVMLLLTECVVDLREM